MENVDAGKLLKKLLCMSDNSDPAADGLKPESESASGEKAKKKAKQSFISKWTFGDDEEYEREASEKVIHGGSARYGTTGPDAPSGPSLGQQIATW